MFQIGQFSDMLLSHAVLMRMKDLAPEMLLAVPCPTCGAASGKRCVLHSGSQRSEPHVDRKLSAAEAVEMKRLNRGTRY